MSEFNIRRKVRKELKEYYSNYYNHNYLRDFRYIFDDRNKYNEVLNSDKMKNAPDIERRGNIFLTRMNHLGHDGLLGAEITYYKTLDEYMNGDINQRWSDKLFFDWDMESDEIQLLKDEFKKAYIQLNGDELTIRIEELQERFRDLIFNHDLLKPTFMEAKKLCLYVEDLGLKPYLIFSGAKGFHCNLFYNETMIKNLSNVSKLYAETFAKKLDLKYLDYAVFDKKKAQRRLQRCHYVHHSKTDLLTIPIPEIYEYDEVLNIIEKNRLKPIKFNMEEYSKTSEEFRQSIIYNDKRFTMMNERRQRDLKRENQRKTIEFQKKYGTKRKRFQDIPMTEIFTAYGGQIIQEDSEKAVVRCLFHGADRHPSAVIFKDSNYFHCSSCGKTLNYYGFIAEAEGLSDKDEILKKVYEFLGD